MFKRTIVAVITFAALLCSGLTVNAAPRHTKDDTWLVYWYICGANLEENSHYATLDIAEMQQVKLPPNVKVLIATGGAKVWHHPTIAAGGEGIYLYSSNRLEKKADWNANMGDPNTLATFLKYGEKNFPADHKVLIFWDHGGLSGVIYDETAVEKKKLPDGTIAVGSTPFLSYDALKSAFAAVYGNSLEEPPFELIGFKACLTGSYELANSLAGFSHYMVGAEPSVFSWNFSDWIGALAKDPSMNGAQIGKVICDTALKSFDEHSKATHTFSVIDLTKMPELRAAYEAYFDEAARRANEEVGFSGAFARAAEAGNVDKYSNIYGDLGLIAKNTKSIMPDASKKLLGAIGNAVVYNKRGAYINSKGISTYYPYVSSEKPYESSDPNVWGTKDEFKLIISNQSSSYAAQKQLYSELLNLNLSALKDGNVVQIDKNSSGHFVAKLMPEQLENISSAYCVLLPVTEGGNSGLGSIDLGGAVLISADDLKINWKKGTFTENFRAVEPVFDGHRITMYPTVSGRGHTIYTVPIIYDYALKRDLLVRYDTSTNKYTIIGFGSMVENGMVRQNIGTPAPGHTITPIYLSVVSADSAAATNEAIGFETDPIGNLVIETDPETGKPRYKYEMSILGSYTDPNNGKTYYLKQTLGTPFVFTRDSAITGKKINKGHYVYLFSFNSPNGDSAGSQVGLLSVNYGQIFRFTPTELELLTEMTKESE